MSKNGDAFLALFDGTMSTSRRWVQLVDEIVCKSAASGGVEMLS